MAISSHRGASAKFSVSLSIWKVAWNESIGLAVPSIEAAPAALPASVGMASAMLSKRTGLKRYLAVRRKSLNEYLAAAQAEKVRACLYGRRRGEEMEAMVPGFMYERALTHAERATCECCVAQRRPCVSAVCHRLQTSAVAPTDVPSCQLSPSQGRASAASMSARDES